MKSDGAQQTTGASARVKIGTGAWGAAAGTLACDSTSGIWTYAPTQAETNADYFIVGAYKASCTSISKTVITSLSSTSGFTHANATQIAGQTASAAGAVTFPGTIASTTNITAAAGCVVSSIATGAMNADALALDALQEIADQILTRNVSNVEGTAGEHTLATAILALLEWSISGGTLTIKRTNGSTTHYTKTLTTDAAAIPIIGVQ